MKTLKFAPLLRELILKWDKTTTWRINDDKDIQIWDKLSLCWWIIEKSSKIITSESWEILNVFAEAIIISTNISTFWNLTPEDFEWHEKFSTHEEMLETYSKYYKINVHNNTELKIIKFKLIEWNH
jgi:hypothetical protein